MGGSKHLFFGGVDVVELAERYGTPLYITDENRLRANYRRYKEAFGVESEIECEVYYAVKANGNLALLRILAVEGAGADVFSTGELHLARYAGIPARKILFNGNSKSDEDLRAALESGVRVSVDSLDELRALSALASETGHGKEVEIAIRVNPDISPRVHPKIATGLKESKFGIPSHEVIQVCEAAERMPNISLSGLHCHIGSQILDVSVFSEATRRMMELVTKLHEHGIDLEFVDLGGGLGIGYTREEKEIAPTPKDLAEAILPHIEAKTRELGLKLKLIIEPGRSIVGSTTILLSRVNAVKRAYRNFVAIDAGFNLLIRPAMYDAYHEVVVANRMEEDGHGHGHDRASELYTVVGPICESGDVIARDRRLPEVERGDLVAILDSGAYGFSMSSQYNGRPRCAEVLVCDGRVDLIRRRESIEDLMRNQEIPERLR